MSTFPPKHEVFVAVSTKYAASHAAELEEFGQRFPDVHVEVLDGLNRIVVQASDVCDRAVEVYTWIHELWPRE